MPTKEYFSRLHNSAFHDLTTKLKLPFNLHSTLGLGPKFCIEQERAPICSKHTFIRLQRDIQRKIFFENNPHLVSKFKFIPRLHIPSKWMPNPMQQCPAANELIYKFRSKIIAARLKLPRRRRTNLTWFQQKSLEFLHKNPDFIVFLCDKNLGPAIMEREEYIKKALSEHLTNEGVYKQLTPGEFSYQLNKQLSDIRKWVKNMGFPTDSPEEKFFERALSVCNRPAQFYLTAKVHKNPWKSRPVVSTCGSNIAALSKWLDFILQPVAKSCPTYIASSTEVQNDLKTLVYSDETIVFTADAISMYTMIDTEKALESITLYLRRFSDLINIDMIIEALGLVMRGNLFQFGDLNFIQLDGTAMGTPVACVYATIYYAWHERTFIIPKYRQFLQYYKRYIDDKLIICNFNKATFEQFKKDLIFGGLNWDIQQVKALEVNFLDLTIYRKGSTFQTKTYEKPMNLYLYIAQHSAHPPGVLKGLIFGQLRRYKQQNSEEKNYYIMAQKLHRRLLNRGYSPDQLRPIFRQAERRLLSESELHRRETVVETYHPGDEFLITLSATQTQDEILRQKQEMDERLFLHFRYHPRDISRTKIQQLFHETCMKTRNCNGQTFNAHSNSSLLNLKRITLAFSRPKNIRDTTIPSVLYQPENLKASTALQRHFR